MSLLERSATMTRVPRASMARRSSSPNATDSASGHNVTLVLFWVHGTPAGQCTKIASMRPSKP